MDTITLLTKLVELADVEMTEAERLDEMATNATQLGQRDKHIARGGAFLEVIHLITGKN